MLKIYNEKTLPELMEKLKNRAAGATGETENSVRNILKNVRENGDRALFELSEKFDGVRPESLIMSREEKETATAMVSPELKETIRKAAGNITDFHARQKQQSWSVNKDGRIMGQRILPLARVGLYVPGGTAAYPSSVLMNAIPAKVAGVGSIVMATPPKAG